MAVNDGELLRWLLLAHRCCDLADALSMAAFRREIEVTQKPDLTLVTDVDSAIETRVRETLAAAEPTHAFLGEELGEQGARTGLRWVVDPIDGTHNYVRGIPVFATLAALERDGEPIVAVVSAPALGQRWFATAGGGAWAMESSAGGDDETVPWPGARRIHASEIASIADAQVLYSSPRAVEESGLAPGFAGLVAASWRDRGFGDFWGYMLVAEGAAEVMVEVGLHAWDIAAPGLIVREAGGRVTGLDGGAELAAAGTLATNGRLHEAVLSALGEPR